MNAQPLPLQDIHLPTQVPWWPLATGWWVLLIFFMLLFFAAVWFVRSRRKRQAFGPLISVCEAAQVEMQSIRRLCDDAGRRHRALQELSALLRRVAISLFPEEKVAGLTGAGWWKWLDSKGGVRLFSDGAGLRLEQAAYRGDSTIDPEELCKAVEIWLRSICSRSA